MCDAGIELVAGEDGYDFRGPHVHGRVGERFVYVTWGDLAQDGSFHMFRRAKLQFDAVPPGVLDRATRTETLDATLNLTFRCSRKPPLLQRATADGRWECRGA